jgi:predicted RNase H-like HicB family nuclease
MLAHVPKSARLLPKKSPIFYKKNYLRNAVSNSVVGHPPEVTTDRKPPGGTRSQDLQFSIETEREDDGRWIAEIPEAPGALAYGMTEQEASAANAIALRTVADDVEKLQDDPPESISSRHRAIA